MENEFNTVSNKQREILSQDIDNLQSNLTAATNNLADIFAILANQDQHFSQQDQQIETVKQKQSELSRLGEGNSQEITSLRKNLTDDIDRLNQNFNSTEEKHRKLSSHVLTHGHGNKQRIDKLAKQFKTVHENQATLISENDVLDQRINVSLTNVTFRMNQIEHQAFENVTALSSQMNATNSGRLLRTSFTHEL